IATYFKIIGRLNWGSADDGQLNAILAQLLGNQCAINLIGEKDDRIWVSIASGSDRRTEVLFLSQIRSGGEELRTQVFNSGCKEIIRALPPVVVEIKNGQLG